MARPDVSLTDDELVERRRPLTVGDRPSRSITTRSADEPRPTSGAGKILERDRRDPFRVDRDRSVN